MAKASLDKLDMKKLLSDICKYGNCGVPREKLDFWNSQLEEFLMEITGTDLNINKLSPLEQLLTKQKYSSTAVRLAQEVPSSVATAVHKDRAPLPEV